MNTPEIKLGVVANLWSKMMHFKEVGDVMHGHSHAFDHLTLLAQGSLNVNVDGVDTPFTAPHMIYIKAGKVHELMALEAGTVAFCIHALRDGENVGDIIDPDDMPEYFDHATNPMVKNLLAKP